MDSLTKIGQQGHWLLRIILAGIFIPHGISKLGGMPAEMVEMMFLGSNFVLVLVGLAELGAGLLYLVGGLKQDWASRLAGLFTAIVMIGAILQLHWPRWHFAPADGFPMGGMQYQVLVLGISLWFILAGNSVGGKEKDAAAS